MPSWGPPPPGRCTCTYWVYIWVLPLRACSRSYRTSPRLGARVFRQVRSKGGGHVSYYVHVACVATSDQGLRLIVDVYWSCPSLRPSAGESVSSAHRAGAYASLCLLTSSSPPPVRTHRSPLVVVHCLLALDRRGLRPPSRSVARLSPASQIRRF